MIIETTWNSSVIYPGPSSENKPRSKGDKFPLKKNLTPSLENPIFPYPDPTPHYDEERGYQVTQKGKKLTIEVESTEDFQGLDLIKKHKKALKLAVNKRVYSVYQQLYLTYGSKREFQQGKTEDQAESATTRTLQDKEGSITIPLDASHNSLVPNLKINWDSDEEDDFLKGSSLQRAWNSTIELPKEFNNGAEKALETALRPEVIRLINLSAKKKITPEVGLTRFVELFLKTINEKKSNYGKEMGGYALTVYKKELLKIKETAKNDSALFYNHLLEIDIDENEDDAMRKFLFQTRYQQILFNASKESEIVNEIETVRKKITYDIQYGSDIFYLLLRFWMNEEAWFKIARIINYESLPEIDPDQTLTKAEKTRLTKLRNAVGSISEKEIKKLAQNLERKLATYAHQNKERQAVTLRAVREKRGLTQEALFKKYKELYPESKITLKNIQEMEKRFDNPPPKRIKRLSIVLGVHLEFFSPQFFDT